ncbi:hypothetical protein [Streptomyces sp. NPDC048438]|uniref:hypothetical protein n=1 Tax=Streptomyces sp. NPDC048438 TaxID=3365551 RepID=UPI00371277D4
MPPYAALPQDVRALGADLLGSPGVVRVPASSWTAYRSALVTLSRVPRARPLRDRHTTDDE